MQDPMDFQDAAHDSAEIEAETSTRAIRGASP